MWKVRKSLCNIDRWIIVDEHSCRYMWSNGEIKKTWFLPPGSGGSFDTQQEAEIVLKKHQLSELQKELEELQKPKSGDVWRLEDREYLIRKYQGKWKVNWTEENRFQQTTYTKENNWVVDTLCKEGEFVFNIYEKDVYYG